LVFTAVMFQVEVFWVVRPCSVVTVKVTWTSETVVSYHNTVWRHISEDLDFNNWNSSFVQVYCYRNRFYLLQDILSKLIHFSGNILIFLLPLDVNGFLTHNP